MTTTTWVEVFSDTHVMLRYRMLTLHVAKLFWTPVMLASGGFAKRFAKTKKSYSTN
jgi:hypothetical protein